MNDLRSPTPRPDDAGMETQSVINVVAALTIALVVIRGIQAGVEHYFPGSDPAVVMRFLYGGP